MITIFIDNKPYQVKEDQNLLSACLSLGFDLPYFCWHPALHSVGACRQCAVKQFKNEQDTRGKIVMSCMTPVADGMRISVDDPEAKKFRASVIEWLMLNHPHDCPVCDEGGECHLQDMTVMTGHTYRKSRFLKRTYRNQNLGPFINHEMNRCITCYRCVRFYRDYAGGKDMNAYASHDNVYFGRHEHGTLESEFSGNLVEVCPTGVFTDKTLKRHYTRKWDLQTAPSVCVHCGIGCNTIPGERYKLLRRIRNRYNPEVNGYFLCDRGRFGYEFVNSDKRIKQPLIKGQPASVDITIKQCAEILAQSSKIIGIGSPRASLESNFSLRTLVGADNFYSGMSAQESKLISRIIDILGNGPSRSASLADVAHADAVLVLGEDLTNTAPMLDLALRQAVRTKPKETAQKLGIPEWNDEAVRTVLQQERGPLYLASIADTKLDEIATKTYHASPDEIARLGFAVANSLDTASPAVTGIADETLSLAKEIAAVLKTAKRPIIISGTSLLNEAVIQAAANIAWALNKIGTLAQICYTVPECNSMGLGLMNPKVLDEALRLEKIETVIILENDLYRRIDRDKADVFFDKIKNLIAIDHLANETSLKADVTLPAATFAETSGTLVNNEARAQRFFQVYVPEGPSRRSWEWLHDILEAMQSPEHSLETLDDTDKKITTEFPLFSKIYEAAPHANFRIAGMKLTRQPHRYSGRTAMTADVTVFEPAPPDDKDSPFAFSMEGYERMPKPPDMAARYWVPGWNSDQALNKFQGTMTDAQHGQRLLDPQNKAGYFKQPPQPFSPKKDELLIVPLYHIFGSEELSSLSPGIAERAPKQQLMISREDAAKLKIKDGDKREITTPAEKQTLTIRVVSSFPLGVAGLMQTHGTVVTSAFFLDLGKTHA